MTSCSEFMDGTMTALPGSSLCLAIFRQRRGFLLRATSMERLKVVVECLARVLA